MCIKVLKPDFIIIKIHEYPDITSIKVYDSGVASQTNWET